VLSGWARGCVELRAGEKPANGRKLLGRSRGQRAGPGQAGRRARGDRTSRMPRASRRKLAVGTSRKASVIRTGGDHVLQVQEPLASLQGSFPLHLHQVALGLVWLYLFFKFNLIYFLRPGSHYVTQASLELLGFCNPPY
jgi:hypothetical protein